MNSDVTMIDVDELYFYINKDIEKCFVHKLIELLSKFNYHNPLHTKKKDYILFKACSITALKDLDNYSFLHIMTRITNLQKN